MPYSKLASVAVTRQTLDLFGMYAKYKFGQNFLVDDNIVGKILDLAELDPVETVLEVGPGIGTLTTALLPRVRGVVAVEVDQDMRGPLELSCIDYGPQLQLVFGDVLSVTQAEISTAAGAIPGGVAGVPSKLVANLPYAVAARLILEWFQNWDAIGCMVVMTQREVADRIAAAPGNKDYGAFTAKLALYAQVTGRFEVPHSCFFPAPHVESAVIRLERRREKLCADRAEEQRVTELINAAFAQRRKTMRNSLQHAGYQPAALDRSFASCSLDPRIRAEKLACQDFIAFSHAYTTALEEQA